MKKFIINVVIFFMLLSLGAKAVNYTWVGGTSTAWNTNANWSPSTGHPSSGSDIATLTGSGTYQPTSPGNLTLYSMVISGGTFNLNGDTLTLATGNCTFSGGTIINGGLLVMRGAQMTFSGTTINARIDAIVATVTLNGGTFNNYCYFETTNNVPGSGTGGCTFNDSTSFFHNYSGSGIWRFNTSTGNTFNGQVRLKNISTGEMTFAGAGVNVFNGNVVMENSSDGGIYFGNDSLRSGYTLTIGTSGYSDGEFRATSFYQAGSTAQSLTFTGTALPTLEGASFNGSFSLTANLLLFKNCTFYSTATITDAGSSSSSWSGGNKFYGNLTVTNNASAGNLRLDADTANTYYANATFNGSRDLRVCYGGAVSSFYGDITSASNTTWHQGSGTLRFYGGNNQTISSTNVLYKTKIEKSSGNVTLSGAHSNTNLLTFIKGNIITTSTNLLTITSTGTVSGASDSSFVEGPVKKIGNSAFIFPIGKNSKYRSAGIAAPSTSTDAYTGEYFNVGQHLGASMDTTINYISDCIYWNVTRNTGSSNVIIKFMVDSMGCDWIQGDSIHIAYWNGTKWVDKGTAVNDSVFKKINTAFSSFGNFVFGYKLKYPQFGLASNFSVFSNDSLVLTDSLFVDDYVGARRCNDTTKISSLNYFVKDSLTLDSIKNKVSLAQTFLKSLNGSSISGSSINGHTLTAGIYNITGSLTLNDNVILSGDTNSIFVFNVSGNLIFANNASINLSGVYAHNVIFNVDSNVTTSGTHFINGIILPKMSATFGGTTSGQLALLALGKVYINSATIATSAYRMQSPGLHHLYTFGCCNLNYTQTTLNLHQRTGSPVSLGASQPAGFTVSGFTGNIYRHTYFLPQ